jgi:hypothetical protein
MGVVLLRGGKDFTQIMDGWHVVDDDDYNQSVGNPKWKV